MISIIEQAIHLETTAEAHYREAAQETTDASAGKILELLANEEGEHAKILRGMMGVASLEDSDVIKNAKAWVRGVVEGGLPAISADANLIDVLRQAMDIEQMTEVFYREQAATAQDTVVKDLFEKLADIEKKHFLFVGSLVEHFDRPNEWIESAEFGLRDEY